MRHRLLATSATLLLAGCDLPVGETQHAFSITETIYDRPLIDNPWWQPGKEHQGPRLNGEYDGSAGTNDLNLVTAVDYAGATLDGHPVTVAVRQGRLIGTVARGGQRSVVTDWRGVRLRGSLDGEPVILEIGAVAAHGWRLTPVDRLYAPPSPETDTYKVFRVVPRDGREGYVPLCSAADADDSYAIPIAQVWDRSGARRGSTTQFTFACLMGAIAKCYEWGYRPWTGPAGIDAGIAAAHQACTRAARADYCGVGRPETRKGTGFFIYDELEVPIRSDSSSRWPLEAAWSEDGATCVNHYRYERDPIACKGRGTIPSCAGPWPPKASLPYRELASPPKRALVFTESSAANGGLQD